MDETIISGFARIVGIPEEKLLGRERTGRLNNARQLLWRLMKANGYTSTRTAEIFHRTHSSILQGTRSINALLETGDRLATYWDEQTRHLILNCVNKIDMSERKEIIEIRTPRYITRARQTEMYTFRGFKCPCCSGRGYTSVETGKDEYRNDPCAICGATGELEANVIIQWIAKNDDRDRKHDTRQPL